MKQEQIKAKRKELQQELREAKTKIHILEAQTVMPIQIKLQALMDECEHPNKYKTTHMGEYCEHCPDCTDACLI